jgi:purine-binding chemotaxis protein CheW
MTTVFQDSLVIFQLGELQIALGVSNVERVVRAVEIAPVPDAPRGVRGVINLQGKIVPVFDLWSRLGQDSREVRTSDHLIIARTHWRTVALLVESIVGVLDRAEAPMTPAAEILPDIESISGVVVLAESLVLVHDIERFLSIEDHEKLQLALNLDA